MRANEMSTIFTAAGETDFPSFAAGDRSFRWISAAEDRQQSATNLEDQESSDDFEFSCPADKGLNFTANIFPSGQIFPVYPIFNLEALDNNSLAGTTEAIHLPLRPLLMEERNTSSRSSSTSSSSSSVDGTDVILPDTFCLWEPRSVPPSPNRWKKSKSSGPSSRRWRLRDLVFGRSHSDGKAKLGSHSEEGSPDREAIKGRKKERNVREMDIVTAHRLYYAKAGGGGQRSFLPYKQNIIAFVGQARHPF